MIKSHKDLAKHIQGKSVLHMNSLGKDSIVCLEWLVNYAKVSKIFSVYFDFIAHNPDDSRYLKYLKRRYPHVEFTSFYNGNELSNFARGHYQSPIDTLVEFNHWEYVEFYMEQQAEEIRKSRNLAFTCIGNSRYESVARAIKFHKKGLLQDHKIYPLGLMGKQDVFSLIKQTGIKLHPSYKIAQSTFDQPSYYKMRSAFAISPEYRKNVMAAYPLLVLDQYRYERLFKK